MQYYSNELHKHNKILGLDNIDFVVITMMYGITVITTPYLFLVCIPLFLYYMRAKKGQSRGFVRHNFYHLQLEKAEGYPKPIMDKFYQ